MVCVYEADTSIWKYWLFLEVFDMYFCRSVGLLLRRIDEWLDNISFPVLNAFHSRKILIVEQWISMHCHQSINKASQCCYNIDHTILSFDCVTPLFWLACSILIFMIDCPVSPIYHHIIHNNSNCCVRREVNQHRWI